MNTLYQIILNKHNELSGITNNPTLDVFNLDFCKQLDELAAADAFVCDRVKKALKELKLAGGIDYNDHYKNAYDCYNEALCYHLLKQKGLDIENIKEEKKPTPDFKVRYSFKNWEQEDATDTAYIEVKSLAFAQGNLQYIKAQKDALKCNIKIEEQRNKGRRFCSGEYVVSPLGDKDHGLTDEIEILIEKINQNIKEEQYKYGKGNDTILLVDLGQYRFPFEKSECLPVYPDLKKKCTSTGRLWTIAFGHLNERIYSEAEFEGKSNFDRNLQKEGILEQYPFIKGIVFMSGTRPEDKCFYGLYRYNEQDLNVIVLIHRICEFVNDNRNSLGFKYFEEIPKKENKRYFQHFKGGKYELLTEGLNSETQEKEVVYQALYGERQVWIRPYDMFFGNVEVNGEIKKRFIEINKAEAYA